MMYLSFLFARRLALKDDDAKRFLRQLDDLGKSYGFKVMMPGGPHGELVENGWSQQPEHPADDDNDGMD